MIKARGSRGRRRSPETLPRVQADVMMVAAGRYESGLGTVPLRQRKTEYAAIELERPFEVSDFEMYMADTSAWINRPNFGTPSRRGQHLVSLVQRQARGNRLPAPAPIFF